MDNVECFETGIDEYGDKYIIHEGTKRHSGRYPWGSGLVPFQHEIWFNRIQKLKSQGIKNDADIAKILNKRYSEYGLNLTSKQIRAINKYGIYLNNSVNSARIIELNQTKQYTRKKISELTGVPLRKINKLLDPIQQKKDKAIKDTMDLITKKIDNEHYLDIGKGTASQMGVSGQMLRDSVEILNSLGYQKLFLNVPNASNPKYNQTIEVLCPIGMNPKELYDHPERVTTYVGGYMEKGKIKRLVEYPESISADRVLVKYRQDGGAEKDGTIEIRRGVKDLDLRNSSYAQVRIGVNGTHYLKGVAFYSDNVPKGYDVIYNTSKDKNKGKLAAMKKMEDDEDNPFGATIKPQPNGQYHYLDKNGKEKLGAINIVNEEGDWKSWGKDISAQFLSKQDPSTAKKQLDLQYAIKKEELEEIMNLTNPVLKKTLLMEFGDECDTDAVNLRAAKFRNQGSYLLLPGNSLRTLKRGKEDINEIYCPNIENGTEVVLLRYPHAGTFELPRCIVNNNNVDCKKIYGKMAVDSIAVNSVTRNQLSGADCDGDTVQVIPTKLPNGKKIADINTYPGANNLVCIRSLRNFPDTMEFEYAMPIDPNTGESVSNGLTERRKQLLMGTVSNLITDMTLQNAPVDEVVRADKFSMVIIDALKHNYDYKKAYSDLRISELHKKYQGKTNGGATTIVSRSKREVDWPQLSNTKYLINEKGEKIYFPTNRTKLVKDKKTGAKKEELIKMKISEMRLHSDARDLIGTKHPMEKVYAEYANNMKSLGNKARLLYKDIKLDNNISPSARKVYAKEIEELNKKVERSFANKPMERKAHIMANIKFKKYKDKYEEKHPGDYIPEKEKGKIRNQFLTQERFNSKSNEIFKREIEITPKEWEAIQSGAISNNRLQDIFNNTDKDKLREYAMPKDQKKMPPAKLNLMKTILENGQYTPAEVAERFGISTSTMYRYLKNS